MFINRDMFVVSPSRIVLVALLAGSLLLNGRVYGQTRLAWPENNTDVARYTSVEECLAATARITDSVEVPEKLQRAIAPLDDHTLLTLPAETIRAAQLCSAKWKADTASLESFSSLFTLYLQANRDADAAKLVQRRLALIAPDNDSLKTLVVNEILSMYMRARPARLAEAESMLHLLEEMPRRSSRVLTRLKGYYDIHVQADLANDLVLARSAATQVARIAAGLTEVEKASGLWVILGRRWVYLVYDYLSAEAQLDSLRNSTAAYTSLVRQNWAKASDERDTGMQFPVGEHAVPLNSEFWFTAKGPDNRASFANTKQSINRNAGHPTDNALPRVLNQTSSQTPNLPSNSSQPSIRPAPGTLSLIIFLENCRDRALECWDTYATIRRIHTRFPDVEVTLVAQTYGFFFDQVPPPPAAEADLYRQWWLEFQNLPVTLAVSQTPFWRLPDPDRRRINGTTLNKTNYSFGSWEVIPQAGFLIDREGIILYANTVNRTSERRFVRFLEILERR